MLSPSAMRLIVSEEAGTTRDVIEVRLDLGGLPVVVSDTAGFRDTQGAVEREGIRRSQAAAEQADLVLWLTDASGPETALPPVLAPLAERMLLVLTQDGSDARRNSHPPRCRTIWFRSRW